MKRIYLDQKDYSNIARGLTGVDNYQEDVEIYHELLKKVKSSEIRIYFSNCHISEIISYELVRNEFIEKYAEVVETLTQGHCLRLFADITELEIQLLLSQEFELDLHINKSDCFYGRYADAISNNGDPFKDLGKHLRALIKREIERSTTGQSKKIYLRKLKNTNQLRRLIEEKKIDEDYARILSKELHIELTKNEVTDIIVKNDKETTLIKRKISDSLLHFSKLLKFFRFKYPQINDLPNLYLSTVKALENFINLIQKNWKKHGHEINDQKILALIKKEIPKSYYSKALKIADSHNLDNNAVIEVVDEMGYEHIKSLKVLILISMEYYKKHKVTSDTLRKFKDNDAIDIMHTCNIPYVDILLTDSFFKDICKKIGPEFNTNILKNTKELMDYI